MLCGPEKGGQVSVQLEQSPSDSETRMGGNGIKKLGAAVLLSIAFLAGGTMNVWAND